MVSKSVRQRKVSYLFVWYRLGSFWNNRNYVMSILISEFVLNHNDETIIS